MIRLKSPRVAVRGIILHENRLLLVNAYPGDESDLWCAPGGGAEPGQSLPDNLVREVAEETGLSGDGRARRASSTSSTIRRRDSTRWTSTSAATIVGGGDSRTAGPIPRES